MQKATPVRPPATTPVVVAAPKQEQRANHAMKSLSASNLMFMVALEAGKYGFTADESDLLMEALRGMDDVSIPAGASPREKARLLRQAMSATDHAAWRAPLTSDEFVEGPTDPVTGRRTFFVDGIALAGR